MTSLVPSMTVLRPSESRRVLEPIDRVSEVLFGLIMVLTFTGSLSVAEAGRDDVRAMLIGALGCNLAWGIIDAILFLMGTLAEKSRNHAALLAVRRTTDPAHGRHLIAAALPPLVAGVMQPDELESVRQRLLKLPAPPPRARLHGGDWYLALGVFLLVFLSTLPVAVPFMVMSQAGPAMRVSNTVAITLLFVNGYAYGRITGRHPILIGCAMVALGAGLVALTIALGG